jgi:hypothetical protein
MRKEVKNEDQKMRMKKNEHKLNEGSKYICEGIQN